MAHLNSGGCEGSKECVTIKEYGEVFTDLAGDPGQSVEKKILLGKPWAYTGILSLNSLLVIFTFCIQEVHHLPFTMLSRRIRGC